VKKYIVRINEHTYPASFEQTTPHHFQVSVEGAVYDIELINRDSVMTWVLRSGESARRAQSRPLHGDIVEAWLEGVPFPVSVRAASSASTALRNEKSVEQRHGGQIRALMPGRVTSVLVNLDNHVEVGSPLVILEAMKMQNEIASPIAGRVKSIHVKDGQTVGKDTLLIEIG
jgi:biotin carboxyl carrier protein